MVHRLGVSDAELIETINMGSKMFLLNFVLRSNSLLEIQTKLLT